MRNIKLGPHLWALTDEADALHQSADGQLEQVSSAVVLQDAAERVHDQQLL